MPPPSHPEPTAPEEPNEYTTAAQPQGVLGGVKAERWSRIIVATFSGSSGRAPEADGAFARLGVWWLNQLRLGNQPDVEAAKRELARLGSAAVLYSIASEAPNVPDDEFRDRLSASVPGNVAVTRYGVFASTREIVVALGAMEASVAPLPKRLAPGEALRLEGELASRFERGTVFVHTPGGEVREARFGSRTFGLSIPLAEEGSYKIEIMGDGSMGPVIALNVPVQVGAAQTQGAQSATAAPRDWSAPDAEARLLELLNEARAKAGVAPLAADESLRSVALEHSDDMLRNHFFGHVSPTTGAPGDRVRRAGTRGLLFGENVGRGNDPDVVHTGLMDSPGHRANMLKAEFTHVGVGVVKERGDVPALIATLVFARMAAGP